MVSERWAFNKQTATTTYIFKIRLFQPSLNDPSGRLMVRVRQLGGNDGGRDELCGVDDFFDSRHSKGDAHSGYTSEMEPENITQSYGV